MTEREWREAIDMRSSVSGIALVVLCGGVLRFWGLGHGIPYAVGVDEPEIVARVVQMMKSGDFNPHFFDYPGLCFYLQLIVACARFMAGAGEGTWRSLEQVGPADFYLWGRVVTAIFGTATVFLVHQIGMRWGARHALLAAGLMAVMPLHVRESHFVLTDVPMAFFTTLTFLLALRAHERGTAGAFAWAGATAGLAVATKYTGLVAIIMPLVAAWMTLGATPSRLACTLAAIGSSVAAFLVSAPYTVLDLPAFLNAFARLAAAHVPGRPIESGWVVYLKHLRGALQWPAMLLLITGLVLGLVRAVKGPGRTRWMLLVGFPLVYYCVIARMYIIYGRYLLPILPFVCVLAAVAVVSGVSLLRRFDIPRPVRTALIAALTIMALLPPAVSAINFDRNMSKQWTQDAAYEWILRNIPKGSRVGIETFGLRLPEERYRSDHFKRLIDEEPEEYVTHGFDYLIASSQAYGPIFNSPQDHPAAYAAYRKLFDQSIELVAIKASDQHPGPELKIYKVKR